MQPRIRTTGLSIRVEGNLRDGYGEGERREVPLGRALKNTPWPVHSRRARIRRSLALYRQTGWLVATKFLWRSLRGTKRVYEVCIGGKSIALRSATSDLSIMHSCLVDLEFVVPALSRDLRPTMILDAGGHIGGAALAFSEQFPDALVISIEPDPENFALLQRNVEKLENVALIHGALTSMAGKKVNLLDRTTECGYTVVQSPGDVPNAKLHAEVDTFSIPEILDRYGQTEVSILKLDVEGAEADILSGPPDWITVVHAVIAELHDEIDSRCTASFELAFSEFDEVVVSGEKRIRMRNGGGIK